MYKINNYTKDEKINIDDLLDGLGFSDDSYKNTNEYNNRILREENNSDVYNRDTYEKPKKTRVININIKLPSIKITSSGKSERQREQDEYDRREEKAWRNFYAANS